MTDQLDTDFIQRFIFDENDARGELVFLERSYAEVLAKHQYPEPVAQLLGEMMAAASLLVGTLKFEGLLILQARSDGPISMLMIECSSELEIRGLARYDAALIAPDSILSDLMPNGVLALTIDPAEGPRHQGIVNFDGETLSDCFTNYFMLSQQVGTRFWLNADGKRARGFLLQQLPADRIKDEEERNESWHNLTALAGTLTVEELMGLDNETILHSLYHQEAIRLFDAQSLRFNCSCSRERSGNALISLGLEDAQSLVVEHGSHIEICCQFCSERYLFDAADISQLFYFAGIDTLSGTRH